MKSIELKNAQWISPGGLCSTPLIRGEFLLPKIKCAQITIAGLGIYEVYINGKRITEDLFLPLTTDFNKRTGGFMYAGERFHDELRHRLYCPQYDVTEHLTEGINTVCFLLGPGWYDFWNERTRYGTVKVAYLLEYTDLQGAECTVCSDASHRWYPSFVKEAHIVKGESHDYSDYDDQWMLPGFNASHWQPVQVDPPVETNLLQQECPADRVIRHVSPTLIWEKGDVRMYDAGELITGYPILKAQQIPSVISARYGELLTPDGQLNEENTYHQHTDYVPDSCDRLLFPRFTWMGFRYFEVTGPAEVEDCVVIHSDVAVDSSFHCGNSTLNWLRDAFIRTQLDNMHCGIPSDCPHAERRGYTGDGQLVGPAAMLQLDAQKFYEKWIWDVSDCQDRKTGWVHNTAPWVPGSGGGPGGWGCAIVMVPYAYYKHYGDTEILRQLYPQMLHYFDNLETLSENDLIVRARGKEWCLGDWCVPQMGMVNDMDSILVPYPMVNNYFYIKSMEAVLHISQILGIHENDDWLRQRIDIKKKAIVDRYFEPETGNFAGNQQGSNAFALDLGLGDERTWENTLQHYRQLGQFDTGIFATDILLRLLFERGEEGLAIALMTSKGENSYHHHEANGSTTLPEYWSGYRSQCHPMFGAPSRYLFEHILGIQQTSDWGYHEIVIDPKCMDLIPSARGHITTVSGKISVEYDENEIRIGIPEQVRASLKLGVQTIQLQSGESKICHRDVTK